MSATEPLGAPDTDALAVFEDVNGPHPKLWAGLRKAWANRQAQALKVDRSAAPDPARDSQRTLVERERLAHLDGIVRGLVLGCSLATGTPKERFYELLREAE